MIKLLIWIFISYGMTTIIVYGTIFNGLRTNISKVSETTIPIVSQLFKFIDGIINCPLCCSTWVGFFLSLFFFSPTTFFIGENYLNLLLDGTLSAGLVWAIHSIIEYFEENRN